ncbi:hypothetical protein AC1659_12460 [Rhodococcus erythropolis]|uniref:hypothetical protein n=1 Tax=Rhodococcus erythropolis TaxID=1833 RepID=UPI001BAB08B2|nr:hypothetical protein [Rhodococcus erythropolis]MBS2990083.1 hypothetical protein [Rhodococcus erythropolis]
MNGDVAALRMVLGLRAMQDGDTAQLMAVVDDLDSAAMVNALMALASMASVYVEMQHGDGTDALLRRNLASAMAANGA